MINAGYRRGATTHRMGGRNNTEVQTFSVYSEGVRGDRQLPAGHDHRSGHPELRLKRRTRDKSVERFRRREVEPEGDSLRDRLTDWLERVELADPYGHRYASVQIGRGVPMTTVAAQLGSRGSR
jgi:Protein of unknown function (DUF3631)